jgi:alpha,alpha-trehalase
MPTRAFFFIESLSSLYTDVQSQRVFADSKHFVDGRPAAPPAVILDRYEKEKQLPGFNLKAFVERYFVFPPDTDTGYHSNNKPLLQHLSDLWDVLKRAPSDTGGTLISLPYPYIVPGGRFREVYYWDTWFTMLGLQVSRRVDIIRNMVDNFSYLLDHLGFIPNANRTYYLGRSQPPFFSLMVTLLSEEDGDGILNKYRPQLEKEYAFWMEGEQMAATAHRHLVKMPGGFHMNRYWDDGDTPRPEAYTEDVELAAHSASPPGTVYRHTRAAAESGWDFSCRWFADGQHMHTLQTTDLIPVDLNCLLLHLEQTLQRTYIFHGDINAAGILNNRIQERRRAIQLYNWNEEAGFYFDYNHVTGRQSGLYTLAAVYPLFFNIATADQAKQVARVLEAQFLHEGGLVTTPYQTGQQWDAPNGWAPLQWMAYKGLINYGLGKLANTIKNRWTATNEKVYAATGKMMEKYNVMDTHTAAGGGEYENQDGFGWTNGVYLALTR